MFQVPIQMIYEKMIHEIAKAYGQCKYYIGKNYRETDFWEMICFENLEGEKNKYNANKKK